MSETGKKQAEALGLLLKEVKVSAVYSSPLKRALYTAQAIANYHQLAVQVEPDLKEIEAGEFEGTVIDDLGTSFSQLLVNWRQEGGSAKLPGGESLIDLEDRVWSAIQHIAGKHKQEVVAVVSHYFVISATICKALGLPLGHLGRIRVQVGSISTLDFDDKQPRLLALGDTCHLTEV